MADLAAMRERWLAASADIPDLLFEVESLRCQLTAAQAALAETMSELRRVCAILGGPTSEKSAIDLAQEAQAEGDRLRRIWDEAAAVWAFREDATAEAVDQLYCIFKSIIEATRVRDAAVAHGRAVLAAAHRRAKEASSEQGEH